MPNVRISEKMPYASKYAEVYDSRMHYLEAGTGDPILFLHGVPTSSYIWRNVIPYLSSLGRCIAPDLIGFGQSDKPKIEYTVFDHIKYIDKFIETLGLKNITLVMHGWGSVIGFNYAMHNENNCHGLAFYEAFLRSANQEIALPYQEQLTDLLDQADIADIAAGGTTYIDKIIAQSAIQQLSEEEMQQYRQPFANEGSGKPILQYLLDLPKGDKQSEVDELIAQYSKKLTKSKLPKLLLYSVPGFVMTIASVMWAKEHLPNLEIVEVGEELHLAPESCPQLIGESISVWMQGFE